MHNKNHFWRILLSAILIVFITPYSYAYCDNHFNQKIQAIIDSDRAMYNIPGIAVSITCPKDTESRNFVSGSTKIKDGQHLHENHLFQVGSETKSFIAVILLQLEAEGLLNIHSKIGTWLMDIPHDWKNITIKQLLNHTSGIYNYTEVLDELFLSKKINYHEEWSAEDLINLVANKSPYFPPGKGWQYSNTNYILAGMIIEKITGKTLQDVMNERLIKPLNLQNTFYIPTHYNTEMMEKIAHGYSKTGLFEDEPFNVTVLNASWAAAAGANISTANDMSIWFKNLITGKILPPKQMRELKSLVDRSNGESIPTTRDSFGYGLAIMHDFKTFNEESWWHSGGTLGYSALMIWLKCSNIFITAQANEKSSDDPSKRSLNLLTQDIVTYIHKASKKVCQA